MSLGLLTTLEKRGLPLLLAVCDDWLVYGPRLDAWMRLFTRRPRAGHFVRAMTRVPTRLPPLSRAAFCFVSDFTRRYALADGWPGISIEIDTVVYSGIDRTDFPPTAPNPREWAWRLLYVGRIDDRKGIETVIRCLPRLPPEASLDIVGRGASAYVESLRGLAAQLGVLDRVQFGVTERSRLREMYTSADAFVFPSEWEEPFGLVPVEAMACATPVVATGTGGSAEFLHDGINCLHFPPGDEVALAGAIRSLAASPELRARLVAGGAATAEDLDVDRLADVFEAWHTSAASRFAGGRPPDRPPPGPPVPDRPSGTAQRPR
jgi:glycosyltransferase involved in cell wall biosynthesis